MTRKRWYHKRTLGTGSLCIDWRAREPAQRLLGRVVDRHNRRATLWVWEPGLGSYNTARGRY